MTTILCVDDDRQLCGILAKAFAGEGYRVLTAFDGDEALETIRQERPDITLLDVSLPRRDGFQVLETLRRDAEAGEHMPVLLLSEGRVSEQYQRRATALAAEELLAKPVPLDRLFSLVRKHAKAPPPRVAPSVERVCDTGEIGALGGLEGTLEELSFGHLIHHLHGLRATGVLMLTNGKKRKALQVRDGYPVAVKSNLVSECFGNMLERHGAITHADFEESLARLKKGEGLQGQILVAMEVMDEEEISAALREQADEKLFEIFAWRSGKYRFQLGAQLKRGNSLGLNRNPADLILEGVRTRLPIRVVDAFLAANADRVVARAESPFYRLQDAELAEAELALLERLDGEAKLGEFAREPESLRRVLYGLLAAELLVLRGGADAAAGEAPAEAASAPRTDAPYIETETGSDRAQRVALAALAERLRGQDFFEMLGVTEFAEDRAIEQAYELLAAGHHPDRFHNATAAVRQLADEVFRRLGEARETLSDPKRRKDYQLECSRGRRKAAEEEEGRRALEAEMQFQRGEAHVRQRNFESALACFGAALQFQSEEGEYHAHYGWALYLCHPDNASMIEEAIEHVTRGLKLAPDREKSYLYLGRLYKAVGRAGAAEKMFTRAVQVRPGCIEAMRELRLINLRRQKSRGLIKRLFRR